MVTEPTLSEFARAGFFSAARSIYLAIGLRKSTILLQCSQMLENLTPVAIPSALIGRLWTPMVIQRKSR